ncbi:uncharacterized protein THITE_158614 [Thermothielavioides terrestris NRRL 8126]|jgi:hypothetical protein|uniref:Uncharacterized protein n=1 Tax=Thermothielavioides terrestris (strain ATCC 38088 / NRRL 8126) TaxID=578455 RepID=G2QVW5_THETT|nr:uncharacterized protein THITE_158614 [Thermothielavioides terrestris NRRL 8126]AEO64697.1 hypothetical protein THITE_158614 [Thermothielavioides terrestris NRRL 8126]
MDFLKQQPARDLKPARLRLANKRETSCSDTQRPARKHVLTDATATEISQPQSPTRVQTTASIRGSSPPVRTITPNLAALVSKFETPGTVDAQWKSRRQPCDPRTIKDPGRTLSMELDRPEASSDTKAAPSPSRGVPPSDNTSTTQDVRAGAAVTSLATVGGHLVEVSQNLDNHSGEGRNEATNVAPSIGGHSPNNSED